MLLDLELEVKTILRFLTNEQATESLKESVHSILYLSMAAENCFTENFPIKKGKIKLKKQRETFSNISLLPSYFIISCIIFLLFWIFILRYAPNIYFFSSYYLVLYRLKNFNEILIKLTVEWKEKKNSPHVTNWHIFSYIFCTVRYFKQKKVI